MDTAAFHKKLSELMSEVGQVTNSMKPLRRSAKRWKSSAARTVVFIGARLPTNECQPPVRETGLQIRRNGPRLQEDVHAAVDVAWHIPLLSTLGCGAQALDGMGYDALNDVGVRSEHRRTYNADRNLPRLAPSCRNVVQH